LIVPTPKGVRLKGCPNEPVFGSLAALVYQHSITPMALSCKLIIPETDPALDVRRGRRDLGETTSTAELLSQGAACSVLYLISVDTESLTGPQAIKNAINELLSMKGTSPSTVVHFKVSSNGITLTDNSRRYKYYSFLLTVEFMFIFAVVYFLVYSFEDITHLVPSVIAALIQITDIILTPWMTQRLLQNHGKS
jgi:tensin-1